MGSPADHGSLVVSSNLTSTMKTLFKEKRIFSRQESDKYFPWVPRECQELRTRHIQPHTKTKDPAVQKGGESVIRLNLGRRLVNLLPVAKRTNALTNGVVDRPWVVGREFESHVHHENAF